MLDKSEIKAGAAHELGVRLDDKLEAMRADLLRQQGGQIALEVAAKALEALFAHVDRDVSEGTYDLDTAKFVKRYIERSVGGLRSLSQKSQGEQVKATGMIQGLEEAVAMTKKFMDQEQAKLRAKEAGRNEVVEGEAKVDHATGTHPGDPMARRRAKKGEGKADEKPSKKTKKTKKKSGTPMQRKKAAAMKKDR